MSIGLTLQQLSQPAPTDVTLGTITTVSNGDKKACFLDTVAAAAHIFGVKMRHHIALNLRRKLRNYRFSIFV